MDFHGTDVRQKTLTLLRAGAKNADVARKKHDRKIALEPWQQALLDAHVGPEY